MAKRMNVIRVHFTPRLLSSGNQNPFHPQIAHGPHLPSLLDGFLRLGRLKGFASFKSASSIDSPLFYTFTP
jgi:hypothetical protein